MDEITIPGTDKKIPKWVAFAGLGGIVLLIVIYTRRGQPQPEPEGSYYDPSKITPGTIESITESQSPGPEELTGPLSEPNWPVSIDPITYPETSGVFNAPFVDPGSYAIPTVSISGQEAVSSYTLPLNTPEVAKANIEATARTMEKPTENFSRNAQVVLTTVKQALQKKSAAAPVTPAKPAQSTVTNRAVSISRPKPAPVTNRAAPTNRAKPAPVTTNSRQNTRSNRGR